MGHRARTQSLEDLLHLGALPVLQGRVGECVEVGCRHVSKEVVPNPVSFGYPIIEWVLARRLADQVDERIGCVEGFQELEELRTRLGVLEVSQYLPPVVWSAVAQFVGHQRVFRVKENARPFVAVVCHAAIFTISFLIDCHTVFLALASLGVRTESARLPNTST